MDPLLCLIMTLDLILTCHTLNLDMDHLLQWPCLIQDMESLDQLMLCLM